MAAWTPYLLEWGSMLLRWLHVTAAIAWIGASFFFMHLDASLRKEARMASGVAGVSWQVHGGGFYEMSKYTLAPPSLPDHLIWHKWQSYWTWISGFSRSRRDASAPLAGGGGGNRRARRRLARL
jgi:uncharacterized membrane protein